MSTVFNSMKWWRYSMKWWQYSMKWWQYSILTSPIQQLLPCCRRNPCSAIFVFSAVLCKTHIRTCFGMQIGRIELVNVTSRLRIAIAKSCVLLLLLLIRKCFGTLTSAWEKLYSGAILDLKHMSFNHYNLEFKFNRSPKEPPARSPDPNGPKTILSIICYKTNADVSPIIGTMK